MKTCVMIDDDLDDLEFFKIALEEARASATFFPFNDASEALLRIADATFAVDYIFLDVNMPKMSGLECVSEIRKIRHLESIPLYIYTTSTHNQEQFLASGATKVILKPTKMSELVAVLTAIVV